MAVWFAVLSRQRPESPELNCGRGLVRFAGAGDSWCSGYEERERKKRTCRISLATQLGSVGVSRKERRALTGRRPVGGNEIRKPLA